MELPLLILMFTRIFPLKARSLTSLCHLGIDSVEFIYDRNQSTRLLNQDCPIPIPPSWQFVLPKQRERNGHHFSTRNHHHEALVFGYIYIIYSFQRGMMAVFNSFSSWSFLAAITVFCYAGQDLACVPCGSCGRPCGDYAKGLLEGLGFWFRGV